VLPFDLEDWLTESGDRVLATPEPWSPHDQLLHEIWLFDTEARNGGPSQYFCNFAERWPMLLRLTEQWLPAFAPVASAIESVISGAADAYEAALEADEKLDAVYETHQIAIVEALKAVVEGD
jgi:hypothetical protein